MEERLERVQTLDRARAWIKVEGREGGREGARGVAVGNESEGGKESHGCTSKPYFMTCTHTRTGIGSSPARRKGRRGGRRGGGRAMA